MKNIIVMISLISMLFATSFETEARKKFGKKRSGKTHQTSSSQQNKKVETNAISPNKAKSKSNKKGIMAGVLGGLLAGGLIAAMLGDNFEGFQLLEMILLAIAAFVIFKLIKGMMAQRRQPELAGANSNNRPTNFSQPQQFQSSHSNVAGFSQKDEVPLNLPENFDLNGFLQGAREHYHTVQKAWNQQDYSTMSEYLSTELVEEFRAEREQLGDVNTEVMFVDTQLVRANTTKDVWEISIKFTGKYRDLGDMQEEPILEIWHLEYQVKGNGSWLIVGLEDLVNT